MKTKIAIIAALAAALTLNAQTNLTTGPLSTLESYLTQNDPTFHGWDINKFTLWQAAAFANVNGVAGASSVGNGVGLEIPLHKYSIHLDSVTDFEQLFGDVHAQSFGLGYDYNLNQIHLSAGFDAQYTFTGNSVHAMPYVELIKQPTTLHGLAPFLRYAYPITRSPGAGRFYVGLGITF